MHISFSMHSTHTGKLLTIVILSLLLGVTVARVSGQANNEAWTTPFNLSNSGSTAEPQIIADNEGTLHVIWQDSVDGSYVHTRNNVTSEESGDEGADSPSGEESAAGVTWSDPLSVELPFGTRRYFPDLSENQPTPLFIPRLAADSAGSFHAIWVDNSENITDENSGTLYYSRVQTGEFDTYGSWSARSNIASDVLKAAIVSGPEGALHVVYIQIADTGTGEELRPAGLYYRRSDDSGNNWSTPVSLAESTYFRLLTPDTANVQLALDGQSLFVAWDDWPHGRVFTVRSADGGLTWDVPNEVDKREEVDGAEVTGPSKIRLFASNGAVHVTWQAGHEGLQCGQFHRWSADGQTWESRRRILETVTGCPTEVRFVGSGQNTFLLITTPSNHFLTAWHGSQWGSPREQPSLNSFVNPETFQTINFTCGQDVISHGDELWVASCGVGISQDIWMQNRPLADLARPPAPSVWEPPVAVSEADTVISSPVLIADEANRLHAFWTQPVSETEALFGPQTTAIQYSQWDMGRWSRTAGVVKSPTGKSDQPSAAVDGQGGLLAVWSGGNFGEIFFSRAATTNAPLPSEWIAPLQLSANETPAGDPVIGVDNAQGIYVVYAIPSGDSRGIYFVNSLDSGDTWSEPSLVFDGAAAGWETVAEPRMVVMDNGQLHLLWLHRPLPTSIGGDSLFYAHSTDGGATWSEARPVSSGSQGTAPVLWHEIISSAGGALHYVWQEWSTGRLSIWQQRSLDDGGTWSEAEQIITVDNINTPATLTTDRAGQLHLLLVNQGGGSFSIRHWIWKGEAWEEEESLFPDNSEISRIQTLQAVALNDMLATIYGGPVASTGVATGGVAVERLFFSQREMDLPAVTPTPLPPTTATPTPTPETSTTPVPTPTPTVVFPVGPLTDSGQLIPGIPAEFNGVAIGLATVVVLMILFFMVIIARRIWQDRVGH